MTESNWRELCEELTGWIERSTRHYVRDPDVLTRARAALSQPGPEVVGPSLEEVEDLCEEHCFNVEGYESIECLQGLINDALARWGRPAPVPVAVNERLPGPGDCDAEGRCWWLVSQDGTSDWLRRSARIRLTAANLESFGITHWLPAPAPAEGEVAELVALLRYEAREADLDLMTAEQCHRAADLLERQAAPVPVAVNERLPGPKDCDAEERCWLLAPRWILPPSELTHWLPATTLPLPAGEVQP